mmetsp:Transcript_8698/g.12682  ORF Transcript_8698/g.12682 Transcript_8698/m.12682 type:complete len:206 (-) Transcript_8698:286-903(-)
MHAFHEAHEASLELLVLCCGDVLSSAISNVDEAHGVVGALATFATRLVPIHDGAHGEVDIRLQHGAQHHGGANGDEAELAVLGNLPSGSFRESLAGTVVIALRLLQFGVRPHLLTLRLGFGLRSDGCHGGRHNDDLEVVLQLLASRQNIFCAFHCRSDHKLLVSAAGARRRGRHHSSRRSPLCRHPGPAAQQRRASIARTLLAAL